jgi:hypothetical protein
MEYYEQGKQDYSEDNCPNATSFTTNLTWTYLRLNPGLRRDRAATNRLRRGTDFKGKKPCLFKDSFRTAQ